MWGKEWSVEEKSNARRGRGLRVERGVDALATNRINLS